MDYLQYNILQSVSGDGRPILRTKEIALTEENEEIAKREAYDGYNIVDSEQPELGTEPSHEERIAELEVALEMLLSGVTE